MYQGQEAARPQLGDPLDEVSPWVRGSGLVACAADERIINALIADGSERSNALQLYQLLQSEAL